jgi:hypothetical protein
MPLDREAIRRALGLNRDLIAEDPALEREFGASAALFGLGRGANGSARQRHLEWFVLERPSSHLGGVPVERLREAWLMRAGAAERGLYEVLAGSLAAAFEVTSAQGESGLWVRDILAQTEYPLEEPEAAGVLEVGDLIVGRAFPLGDGRFVLSGAASAFHEVELVAALARDLAGLRRSRRGVLRIEQLELERLFFGVERGRAASEIGHGRACHALEQAGLTADESARALRELCGSESVTDILNRLGFETSADLETIRGILLERWLELGPGVAEQTPGCAPEATPNTALALANFDRGRREGRDVEQLIRELERALGVDVLDEDEDEAGAPDFPGVVGAMVEEFLWDVAREEGEEAARELQSARLLSVWGERIGVFEELAARDLIEFSARWILDEGRLTSAEEAHRTLGSLARFCRWCEESQDLALWRSYALAHGRIALELPRHLALRWRTGWERPSAPRSYRLITSEASGIEVETTSGERLQVRVVEGLRGLLVSGDVLIGAIDSEGWLRMAAAYPSELWTILT